MAIGLVQTAVTTIPVATATFTATLGSTPTEGNLLVAVMTHQNKNVNEFPADPDFVRIGYSKASMKIAVWAKEAGAAESSAITFTLGVQQNAILRVYELSGSWVSAVAGDGQGVDSSASANTLTASTTTGDTGGAVMAITVVNNASTIAHTMSADRTDTDTRSTAITLSVALDVNTTAGSFSDTASWSVANLCEQMVLGIREGGAVTLTGELALSGTSSQTLAGSRARAGITVLQVASSASTATPPAVTFAGPIAEGNLVLAFLGHVNANIDTHGTNGYGPLAEMQDGTAFTSANPANRAPFTTGNWFGAFGKIAGPAESQTVTFDQNQNQNTRIIAYELSGSWDTAVLDAYAFSGSATAVSSLDMDTITTGHYGAVLAATYCAQDDGAISHSMSTDRVDVVLGSAAGNRQLSVAVNTRTDAGEHLNVASWSTPAVVSGLLLGIRDQGENTVVNSAISDALTGKVADALTAAETALDLLGLTTLADAMAAGVATVDTGADDLDDLLDRVGVWQGAYRAADVEVVLAFDDVLDEGRETAMAFEAAKNQLSDGWHLRIPAGRYRAEGGLVFSDLSDLTITGAAQIPTVYWTQYRQLGRRKHFLFDALATPVIRNLRAEGINTTNDPSTTVPLLESGRGFYRSNFENVDAFTFTDCTDITGENLYAYGVYGDGLRITDCIGGDFATVDIRWNGRQGIVCDGSECRDIVIDGVYIPNGRRSNFDPEPNFDLFNTKNQAVPFYAIIDNITVRNVISDAQNSHVASGGRGQVTNITVENWTCVQSGAFAVATGTGGAMPVGTAGRDNWLISNWTLLTPTHAKELFSIGSLNTPPAPGSLEDIWLAGHPDVAYQASQGFTFEDIDWEMTVAEAAIEFEFYTGVATITNFDGGLAAAIDTSHPRYTGTLVESGNSW